MQRNVIDVPGYELVVDEFGEFHQVVGGLIFVPVARDRDTAEDKKQCNSPND